MKTDSSEELEIVKTSKVQEEKVVEEVKEPVIDYSKILQEEEEKYNKDVEELNNKISNWEKTNKEEIEKLHTEKEKEKEETVKAAKLGRIENL